MKASNKGRLSRTSQPVLNKLGNVCTYSEYQCTLPCIENYDFCMNHILEDHSAPFKQCNFIFPNSSHRCFRAASKVDKDGLCHKHACKSFCDNQKLRIKKKQAENPEISLQKLSHHRMLPVSSIHTAFPDPASVPSVAAKALEYHLDSNEEEELNNIDVLALPRIEDDSDIDVNSDSECLDHLGTFTTEEVTRIYIEKLQKLKNMYIGEFKVLTHQLKENRKEYLQASKKEKQTMMSIHHQPKDSVSEQETYKELKAMVKYQRISGKEQLLRTQQIQRTLRASEGSSIKPTLNVGCVKCTYSEGSWKCGEQSVPLSKFCFKHILQDPKQNLFKKCDIVNGNEEECATPVVQLPFLPSCVHHLPIPPFMPLTDATETVNKDGINTTLTVPTVVNLSDSSAFVVTEVPPEDVMEGDTITIKP